MSEPIERPPVRFGDEDVALVLRRAAELQAGRAEDAQGVALADVERIAQEAGIDPLYVRQASTELPQLKRASLAAHPTPRYRKYGIETHVQRELTIRRALQVPAMQTIARSFATSFGESGTYAVGDAELTWSAVNSDRRCTLVLHSYNDHTTVSAVTSLSEALDRKALQLAVATIVSTLVCAAFLLTRLHAPMVALASLIFLPLTTAAFAMDFARKRTHLESARLDRALDALQLEVPIQDGSDDARDA